MAVDRTRPPPQPGRTSSRSGSRKAEDEQRRPHPVREVLDEVEHRLLGPVDVLEEEDERLHVAQRVHDLARGPRDLLRAALALDGFQQARGQADEVGDSVVLAALAKLLERLLERLVVGDPDRRLDHLGERPVRHALAVRQAAALEHACAVHRVDELAGQPALADTRLAVDREEVRAAVAQRSLVRVLEQLQLGLAADERSADVDVPLVDGAENAPGAHRGAHALELERACVLDDAAARERGGARSGRRGSRRASPPAVGAPRGSRLRPWRTSSPPGRRRPRRPRCRRAPRGSARGSRRASRAQPAQRARRRPRAPAGCRTPQARRRPRTSRRCRRAR